MLHPLMKTLGSALLISLATFATACSGDDPLPDAGVTDTGPVADGGGDMDAGSTACTMDEDCVVPGEGCDLLVGECRVECTTHADCGGDNVCLGGYCQGAPACAAGQCPEDLICDANDVCRPPVMCTDDMDCSGGDICAGGVCQPPVSCMDSTECDSSLRCIEGICRDPCTADGDCGDPMTNTCETASGECRLRCLINDEDCPANFICESLVCIPAECVLDSDCPGNDMACRGAADGRGRCVEALACDAMNPCPNNFFCNNMMQCEELPTCLTDRDCGPMAICEDRHCQPTTGCMNDGDCGANEDCIADLCVPTICRGHSDCAAPTPFCIAGVCSAPADPAAVSEIRIISPAATVNVGFVYDYEAVALDSAGSVLSGIEFDWTTLDQNTATIDASGSATAVASGSTQVVASVVANMMTVSSSTVSLHVYDPNSSGTRLTVVSEESGEPIVGTDIICDTTNLVTDNRGQAIAGIVAVNTCTVFAQGHDYLTVAAIPGTDVELRVPRANGRTATGYSGTPNFSMVPGSGPVELTFSGGSFGGPLNTFDLNGLFGGDVFVVDVPIIGDINLPAGMTAAASVQGIPLNLKGDYYGTTQDGLRRPWSFGGYAQLADLGLTSGNLLANPLPLLQTFAHDTGAGLDTLVDSPMVVDAADIDGDGDTTELVPDYNQYANRSLAPNRAMQLRVQIDPAGSQIPAGTTHLVVLVGSLQPSVGFVPLGLDGTASSTMSVPNAFTMKLAPGYAGLEDGRYVVLAAATEIVSGELPRLIAMTWEVFDELPETAFVSAFPSPTTGVVDPLTRTVTVGPLTTGSAWRTRMQGEQGSWEVRAPRVGTMQVVLPTPPNGFEDRVTAEASFDVVKFDNGVQGYELWHALDGQALETDSTVVGFARSDAQ